MLLLARPTVLEASYSPVVEYGRNGGVGRRWTEVALRDGVATVPLRGPLPPAFRVRVDGYDAGPLGATPLGLPTPSPSGPLAESLLDALGPFVAACTGLPASVVRSRIVLEAAVPGDVLVQAARGEKLGPGRVVVVHTDLPSGALLRSVRVGGDGRGEAGPVDVETTRVLDDADPATPFATRLPAFRADVSRFLVVAPRAARAQLVAASSNTYPASAVTALRGGTGVLEVADARRAAVYSLVTWDRRGRRLGGSTRCSVAVTRATCGRGCADAHEPSPRVRKWLPGQPFPHSSRRGVSGPGWRRQRLRRPRPPGRGTRPGRSA